MTRKEKRKTWSALIVEQKASGMNMRAWCEARGVGYSNFLYWRQRITDQQEREECSIRFVLGNGLLLEIMPGFDSKTLQQLLVVLQDLQLLSLAANAVDDPDRPDQDFQDLRSVLQRNI